MTDSHADVLVVGAGPTGLTLAAVLAAHGVRPRLVDRARDRVHESRALAIQPRTLEVLAGLGVSDTLVSLGNPDVRLHLHVAGRDIPVPLFDVGLADTAYPYLLFLSQGQTERVLAEHLSAHGVAVQRGVGLFGMDQHDDRVVCRLRHGDGSEEVVDAAYVVGCDGAHSTVRERAGIPFAGGSYPQTFLLADLEADGIRPGSAHAFLSARGLLFFFPLVQPASWRMLAMRPQGLPVEPSTDVTLAQVQALADAYTGRSVLLHDPVWMTNFRLHHRAATRYRAGRVFLAGDAAHIHSPAGGQGMNTGIQDAVNLGWKLAHVLRGSNAGLLATYETERAPVGRSVVRMTDRAFGIAASANPLIAFARARLAPLVLSLAPRISTGRAYLFRTLAELGIHYRCSPLSIEDGGRARHGARAGDRLPDATIIHKGAQTTLHAALGEPAWHLLTCEADEPSLRAAVQRLPERYHGSVRVHHLTSRSGGSDLHDPDGVALQRLGVRRGRPAVLLVRPDGHVGYRTGTVGVGGLEAYLRRWLPPEAARR